MSKQSRPELENMKFEVAREMGVNLTRGYNGNLSSVRTAAWAVRWCARWSRTISDSTARRSKRRQ